MVVTANEGELATEFTAWGAVALAVVRRIELNIDILYYVYDK